MREGSDGASRKLPLEPDHDVNKNQQQCEDHRQAALLGKLAADLRADGLDTPQIDRLVSRRERFL